MNRFISIILTFILVLSMPVVSVQAQSSISVSITNPAHGSSVQNTAFDVELFSSGDISEIILELDGKVIEGTRLTESMLTLGEHTLTAYAIGNDGSVESDTSTFTVEKKLDPVVIFDQNFNDSSKFPSDFSLTAAGVAFGDGSDNSSTLTKNLTKNIQATRQSSKDWVATVASVDGPQGSSDGAYNMTSTTGNTGSSRPALNISFVNHFVSSKTEFEFDIKLNSDTRVKLAFTGVNKDTDSNRTAYISGNSDIYLFSRTTSNGTIAGQSSCKYKVNKWYHVKMVLNTSSLGTYLDLIVTGEDESGQIAVQNVLTNCAVMETTLTALACPIKQITLDYGGGNGMGFSFDNVKLTEYPTYSKIDKLAFLYDDVETSDAYPDSSRLTGIKLYTNDVLTANSVSDKLFITDANGNPIAAKSVTANYTDNTITALFNDNFKLNSNTEYYVNLRLSSTCRHSGITDADNYAVSFKTAAESYDVTGIDLSANGTKLFTATQLNGKKLKAMLHFSNSEISPQYVVAVLAVRKNNGKELVGLDINDATVESLNPDYQLELETDTISGEYTDLTIQIMFLSSIPNGKPVFATREFKY